MSTQPPFSWLAQAADTLRAQLPPNLAQAMVSAPWLIHEVQQRMVLFLNHVLMQEPAARDRLQRQKGRVLQVCWRDQVFQCQFTPAGLLELVAPSTSTRAADLVLRVNETSPLALVKTLAQGDKPAIRIEGDVHYETLSIEQGAQVDGRLSQRNSAPKLLTSGLSEAAED